MLFATALTERVDRRRAGDARYRPLYIALAREILAVAAARGVCRRRHSTASIPTAYLANAPHGAAERSLDALVAHNRRSAKSHSGIWRDLAVRKRPTEVDAQLGIVVTLGTEAGIRARSPRAWSADSRDRARGTAAVARRRSPRWPHADPQRRLMHFNFNGRTAIVTGAAHGFGRAIAAAFAERGAQRLGVRCRSRTSSTRRKLSAATPVDRAARASPTSRDRAAVDACVSAAAPPRAVSTSW